MDRPMGGSATGQHVSKIGREIIEGNPDPITDAELEDRAIPVLDRLYP